MSHKYQQLKFALGACALVAMLGFAQAATNTPSNTLWVAPCSVDYTAINQVDCHAYIQLDGVEYRAQISTVDYSYLNDVDVQFTLDHYPAPATEQQIYQQLRGHFDQRRYHWIKGALP